MIFFSIPTISSASPAKITDGWSKLAEFTRTLPADALKHERHFLHGRMDEVY
jgi:hypothetical protein